MLTGRYSDSMYYRASQERDAFLSTMQAFQEEDQEHSRVNLAILQRSEWNKFLLQAVDEAQFDAEVTAVKGKRGAIRNLARRLGSAGPAFVGWLAILPEDAYGSVVCGGFKIIINAAIRHKELCEEVFDALGEIPEAITDAKFFLGAYESKSDVLQERVAELYTMITLTLHGILRFYRDRASGRNMRAAMNAVKAMAKGSNYGRKLEADIKNVRASATSVKQEAERCFQGRVGDMQSTQNLMLPLLQAIYQLLQYNHEVREAKQVMHRNCMKEIIPKPIRKSGPSPRRVSELTRTSPGIAVQDLGDVQQAATSFSTSVQSQVIDLISSSKLQDWITSPYSCAMLVLGTEGDEKISALSFVASLLIQSVQYSQNAALLSFYCGLHTETYRDTIASASGMVRNLTAQLLQIRSNSLEFGFEFIDRKFMQALESDSLEAVCDLFQTLIHQLPDDTTLFLIIDGISFYETADRLDDTLYAMSRMMQLVDNAKLVIKLLVTTPGASAHVTKLFSLEETFWLPDIDPEEDEAYEHKIATFTEHVTTQATTSHMSLMRSNSEHDHEL